MMFDRSSHIRALSANPDVVAKRRATLIERHGVKWTPAMESALTEMALARLGERVIAKRIGVGKDQVRKRRRELALPMGKPGGAR
jgi:hypothetical protein